MPPLSLPLFTVIVVIFVISGTAVTITGKWCDSQSAMGSNPQQKHIFYHPYFQTNQMFLTEMVCLVIFMIWFYCYGKKLPGQVDQCRNFMRDKKSLVWIVPATMDLIANGLNYCALTSTLTRASNFQMIRGCVILFTGFLSVVLFHVKLAMNQWLGMILMFIGFILVGAKSSFSDTSYSFNSDIIAIFFLLILAQFFTAVQFEKLMKKFSVHPLQAVGLEGLYGFVIMSVLLVIMYYVPYTLPYSHPQVNQTVTRFEDSVDAIVMLAQGTYLLLSYLLLLIALIGLNATNRTIIRERNAITLVVLDSIRSLPIWWLSMAVNWEKFDPFGL